MLLVFHTEYHCVYLVYNDVSSVYQDVITPYTCNDITINNYKEMHNE